MTKNNETTLKFNADISGLKKGIADANRQIKIANSAFKAAASGLDNWSDSADGLTAKISQLEAVQDAENKKLEMLNKQYELTAAELGETSEEAENLKIKINNQQAAVNKITGELGNYRDKLENIRNTTEQSVSAYDKLTNEISQQESELNDLQRQYSNYVVEGNEASDEARQLAARISELSGDLNANRTALKNADNAADDLTDSMDDLGDAADDAGEATETLSDGFSVVKGALADLVADGIRAAADAFKDLAVESDKAFNSFQAQTGASAEEMAAFEDQINDLYKNNFGEDMNDVADAMARVAQSSKETDPSKIKELAENAFILRDTFGFEIEESMRAVNMLMDQFGMSGEEAFNLIAQGAQNGLNKNGDLLDSINEYSVHYKQLGYTGEEFFNSLSNGTAAGTFSVDKLGDAMKEFGIRAKDSSESTAAAFSAIGVAAADNSKDIESVQKEISSLEKKLESATEKQDRLNLKSSELAKSGTEKHNKEIEKLNDTITKLEKNLKYAKMEQDDLSNSSTEKYNKEVEKLNSTISKLEKNLKYAKAEQAGFTKKTSELTKQKNADKIAEYTKQLEEAKNELQQLTTTQSNFNDSTKGIKNADKIAEYTAQLDEAKSKLAELTSGQTDYTSASNEFDKTKNAEKIAEYSAELENAKARLAELQDTGGKQFASDMFAKFAEGGETARAATQEVLDALFAMDDKVQQDAAGVALFGTMWEDLGADGVKALMDVNGEADKTAATMEEINSIKYNDIGSAFSEIGRIIKIDLLQPIVTELMPTVNEFVDWLKSDAIPWLIDNANELIAVITSIGAAFVAFKVVSIIQGIISAFAALIPVIKSVGVAQAALNLIMAANPVVLIVAAIAALVAGFIYLWNTSDEFREFWINLWDGIKEAATAAIDGIKTFFTGLWNFIKDNWQGLLMLLVNPFVGAFKLIYDNCDGFREFIDNLVRAVGEFFTDLWTGISTAAGEAWAKIKEFFAPATEWFTKLFTSVKDSFDSVINVIVGLAKGCWAIIQRVFEVVGGWFNKNVITPVKKFFTDMWKTISDAAKTAWTFISGVFKVAATWFNDKIVSPISDFFTGMWDGIKNGASDAWDGITSVFGVVVDWFREKFSAAWQAVKDVFSTGGKIFDGIKDGIVSAFATVVNTIIRGINRIITIPFDAINSMLNKIRSINILDIEPFAGLWDENPLKIPQIPELAKGGVLKRGQVGLLEGDGTEAVVPLEKNTEWIKRVAGELSQQFNKPGGNSSITNGGTVNNYTFNQTNNSPKALNRLEIYRQSKQQTAFIKAVTSGV